MDEQTQTAPVAPEVEAAKEPPAPKKPNPILKLLKEKPAARHILAYAILVGLIAFAWARGGWMAASAQREGLVAGMEGIAATFVGAAYQSNTSAMERTLRDIVQQGGFRSATFTNMEGEVLASTDLSRKGQRLPEFARAKEKAEFLNTAQGPVLRRQVYMAAGNPRGVLEIALQ